MNRRISVLDELDTLDEGESLPRLYTLSGPFEEMKQVVEASMAGGKLAGEEEPLDYASEVLLVGDEPYPVVVVYDLQLQEIVFYVAHHIPAVEASPPATRHLRPSELLAQPPAPIASLPSAARPSLHRTASAFSAAGDRRVSALNTESMDRTRRGPRVSRGGMVEPQHASALPTGPTGELQAALDPPTLASTIAPTAGSRIKNKGKGRVSLTADSNRRESAGSSFFMEAQDRLPALLDAGEHDWREPTMLMGIDKQEVGKRSDTVLERVFSWKPPE
jgi:anaphase-promoting complex subunit 1